LRGFGLGSITANPRNYHSKSRGQKSVADNASYTMGEDRRRTTDELAFSSFCPLCCGSGSGGTEVRCVFSNSRGAGAIGSREDRDKVPEIFKLCCKSGVVSGRAILRSGAGPDWYTDLNSAERCKGKIAWLALVDKVMRWICVNLNRTACLSSISWTDKLLSPTTQLHLPEPSRHLVDREGSKVPILSKERLYCITHPFRSHCPVMKS
jgi:hypothetical protein